MDDSFFTNRHPAASRILLLRHAERFGISDLRSATVALLTEKGKADSYQLGRRLARGAIPVKVCHSTVPRCADTAVRICAGLEEAGGGPIPCQPLSWLAGDFINMDAEFASREVGRVGMSAFIRNWFDRAYPETAVTPAAQAARFQLERLAEQLHGQAGFILDISHDWNIMLLLEFYLQLRHEEVGFPDFLEGVEISTPEKGGSSNLLLRTHGKSVIVDFGPGIDGTGR